MGAEEVLDSQLSLNRTRKLEKVQKPRAEFAKMKIRQSLALFLSPSVRRLFSASPLFLHFIRGRCNWRTIPRASTSTQKFVSQVSDP